MADVKYWVDSDHLQWNVSDYQLEWVPTMLLVTIGVMTLHTFETRVYQLLQPMSLNDAKRIFLRLTASIDPKNNTFTRLDDLGFKLLRETKRPRRN